LGPGHVHAEASIRMNFDKVKETQEKFDPDGSVVRSTQNVTSNSKTTDKTGPVSLQNNLPNADAGAAAAAGTQEGKQEETTNYEIGKTVRAIVHDQPQIERITLAVMVDGTDVVGTDGKHTWKPRDQAQLDQITQLVKSAIGFDAKRGDQLDVVSMPFVSTLDQAEATPASRPARANRDLVTFLQMIAFGVVGFGIIILTARSIFTALNKPPVGLTIAGPAAGGMAGEITDAGTPGAISLQPAPLGIGHAATGNALATVEDDDIVTMSNIQGQLRASSIRKVTQLVDRHPDTTLGIIRGWIATDHG
ncbi:MAG TPA: flagellar M-ring protein FliF C-terminal domain-containing protein, partial [Rhodopila sp.]